MHHHVFRYIGIAAIVLLVTGLSGWYFFLRGQQENIEGLSEARGFDIAVPAFTGSRSSTSENIAQGSSAETLLSVQTSDKPPRLWRVSTSPVAGAAFLSGTTTLRYVERSTGHVYDVDPVTGEATRRTNTLVPKIYDAAIASDGSMLLRTIENDTHVAIAATLGTTTEDGFRRLDTANLGTSVFAAVPSPSLPEILLVAASANGAELIRSKADGAPQRVLSLFLTTLAPQWLSDGRIFLTERPASGIAGSAYEVVSGTLVPLVRNVFGLAVLPRPSSPALLYSSDDGARLRMFARASATASTTELSIQTTAEKCVWAPGRTGTSTFPVLTAYCAVPQNAVPASFTDSWLRGATHTADAWFTIDVSAAKSDRFFVPESSIALDVERPIIDAAGEYIAFTNARDKSLWILRIEE